MAIIFFRTFIVFLSLVIFMRLLGKRQLGELELSELVVSVLVANLVAMPLQDIGVPLLNGLVPVLILFCCEMLISGATLKSVKFRALIYGTPSILVEDGVINQYEMQKNRFTLDELTEELRNKNIMDISKIKYAILETDGTLNTILKAPEQPVTAAQMNVETTEAAMPNIIINNGRIISNNLQLNGRDNRWLQKELSNRGVSDPEEVYIMTLSATGEIYFAKKETKKK